MYGHELSMYMTNTKYNWDNKHAYHKGACVTVTVVILLNISKQSDPTYSHVHILVS